jgi:hypothetical protein
VAADAVDRPGIDHVLDGGLYQPQVGQDAQEDQGGQQGQGEQVERSAERPLLSAMVAERAVWRVKCSVVRACSSCRWRSLSST